MTKHTYDSIGFLPGQSLVVDTTQSDVVFLSAEGPYIDDNGENDFDCVMITLTKMDIETLIRQLRKWRRK